MDSPPPTASFFSTRRARANFLAGSLALMLGAIAQAATPSTIPADGELPRFGWSIATGYLTDVGGGATPLDYDVVPVIASLKLRPHVNREWQGGRLTLRPRFDLLLEPLVRGPETFFGGVTAAGELEWLAPSRRYSTFFSSGGGVGWLDSKGYEVVGAQGQDFNFTWFVHAGARFDPHPRWRATLGLFFQHISNRNQDPINPGINLLGPTFSLSRRF